MEQFREPGRVSEFYKEVRLRNGLEVTVRAVRPDDKQRINEAFKNLERETIYTRYFHHKTFLSEADLKWATELDFINDVAIVVTIMEGDQEVVIGGSRYSVLRGNGSSPKHAEIAFTVEEDYQGLGMAKMLLRTMAEIACSQGIAAFEAEVLPENAAMIVVFERSGMNTARRREDGSVHFTIDLAATDD